MKKGFSLIELLVVIAIIAILAAIAFPVFSRSKDAAYRSSDMSKMNELRTALQLYRTDQGGYPPALLGYATGYMPDGVTPGDPNPTTLNVVPAEQAVSALFPKRVSGLSTFQPSYDRPLSSQFSKEFSEAVWPDGQIFTGSSNRSDQAYGPARLADRCVDTNGNGGFDAGDTVVPRYFYKLSGFDAATVPDGAGDRRHELHYSPFFTAWTVPANPCNPQPDEMGSALDDPRQLGYYDPPDNTVVTWDTFFREYDSSDQVVQGKRDIVLFLGGSAKMMDSYRVSKMAWKVMP